MSFSFRELDELLYRRTETKWQEQIDADLDETIFPPAYHQSLAWAHEVVQRDASDSNYSYGLIRDGEDHACALAEIVHAPAHPDGSSVRLLRVRLEPRLDASEGLNGTLRGEILEATTCLLLKCLELCDGPLPAGNTKICGASPLSREFLELLSAALHQEAGIETHLAGNWLVIPRESVRAAVGWSGGG